MPGCASPTSEPEWQIWPAVRSSGCHEPVAVQQWYAADLLGELIAGQEAFEDLVAGPVFEHSLLPLLGLDARTQGRVHHQEFGRHPSGGREERGALGGRQMPVEVAGEHAVERPSAKGRSRPSPTMATPSGSRD